MVPNPEHPSTAFHSTRSDRRTVLRGLAVTGLTLAWQRRAAAQEATPVLQPPVIGATFIGQTTDPETLVAVVTPYSPDEETNACLCNGHDLTKWCSGPTRDVVILEATDGTTVIGRVDTAAASGKVAMPGGQLLSFVADRAVGIAGLYDVTLTDGAAEGTAGDGQRLSGQVVDQLADGTRLLAGTIEEASGRPFAFATFVSPDAAGEMRWIVLPDGRLAGGPKEGLGTGWASPVSGERL